MDTTLCESKLLFDAVDEVSLSAISPSDEHLGLQMGAGVQTLVDEVYFVSLFVGDWPDDKVPRGVVLNIDVVEVVRLFLKKKKNGFI